MRPDLILGHTRTGVKGSVACLPPSRGLRDDGWRRYLSIMLDALRPEAATPLPVAPLTYEEMEAALIGDAVD